ncbi:hypothetical protein CYMTET_4296 [Cymbomonas tetramitiformis]|uniref:Uncharacterized protein n=1 Tax=Cymbomonas tetramitiformis TaxID=36881 RepID=A0AAE0H1D6_9CHLO|nr:hypothetical protein CYMTET_4296 [Cymbomonas tetramitiformis]
MTQINYGPPELSNLYEKPRIKTSEDKLRDYLLGRDTRLGRKPTTTTENNFVSIWAKTVLQNNSTGHGEREAHGDAPSFQNIVERRARHPHDISLIARSLHHSGNSSPSLGQAASAYRYSFGPRQSRMKIPVERVTAWSQQQPYVFPVGATPSYPPRQLSFREGARERSTLRSPAQTSWGSLPSSRSACPAGTSFSRGSGVCSTTTRPYAHLRQHRFH